MKKLKKAGNALRELRYFEKQFLAGNMSYRSMLVGNCIYGYFTLEQIRFKIEKIKKEMAAMLK